jgi:hypothetical protein
MLLASGKLEQPVLTNEVGRFGEKMKTARLIAAFVSIAITAACRAERAVSLHAAAPTFASSIIAPSSAGQLPLLFIVDGVRYAGDQVPLLSVEQVAAVQVIKGQRALTEYGPDASYGVVVITTKLASVRRS